jgi:hypothetical protein
LTNGHELGVVAVGFSGGQVSSNECPVVSKLT